MKKKGQPRRVALLAEGVDRNFVVAEHHHAAKMSPSSLRAWIEIQWMILKTAIPKKVALLAEGVDRNIKKALGGE